MADPVKAIANRLRRRCGGLAKLSLEAGESEAWRSLLFDGGRHHFALSFDGERIDEAISAICEEIDSSDFSIPGHLVAELKVAAIERHASHALIRLDAMTIVQ